MMMFKGYITALITPFRNGEIDWKAFDNLVEWQIEQGISGLVPCGTTGESPTLSHEEHMAVVKRCVNVVNKRVPVIAGTGSNSTTEALGLTWHARESGADAALVVVPYYNKPSQEGLYQHYKAIQDVGLPVIIYNVPGRTVADINIDTVARLAELPNVTGIKDATGDLVRPLLIRGKIGPGFCQLSGEDATIGAFLGQGGHGCISVTSNVAPDLCSRLYDAWENREMETFAELRDRLAPLHKALFCETSPAPVKYATSVLGLTTDEIRMPLLVASKQARATVNEAMEYAGVMPESSIVRISASA
jgi:4-hydroxy-tetrahydrodipicolinate synthase